MQRPVTAVFRYNVELVNDMRAMTCVPCTSADDVDCPSHNSASSAVVHSLAHVILVHVHAIQTC